jgi:glycosyltransferase involved in cell wall biosynthesis
MQHGASQAPIERGAAEGGVLVGEPVNAHPRVVQALLREEYERLGLPTGSVEDLNNGQKQTIEEAKRCDMLLAPSRFVAESYVQAGIAPEKVSVIPYGANLQQFSPGVRRVDGIFRVLCVSQISTRKGHVDLLQAWRQLNLPNARLELIGSMTDEMQTVLERYAGQFIFRGHVPHHELVHEYRQADVVVAPSIEDGFSVVPLEAMACGVPVIVSRNAGVSEVIDDGETGFVVPARAPDRIASALESLYRSPELRRRMGETAERRMRESMSWELYVERLMGLYSKAFALISSSQRDVSGGSASNVGESRKP